MVYVDAEGKRPEGPLVSEGRLLSRLRGLLRRRLVQNILSLYGVQIASYAVPLVTIPYLTRVLEPAGWGLYAFAQSFGGILTIFGEYGFSLSGTREIAREQDSRDRQGEILAGVLGAKFLLAMLAILVALAVEMLVSTFRAHPGLLWAAMFWSVGQSFSMMWFFQGLERMRLVAALDVSARALATVGIFVFVRSPQGAWVALALQGAAAMLSVSTALAIAYRGVPFRLPTWRLSWEALRRGWTIFFFRSSVSLYTVGNAFILGMFVSPELVGYYAGAEKIAKAFFGLLGPVSQALYPRLSNLVKHSRAEAARLARLSALVMGGGGLLMGFGVFVFAHPLVRILLGAGLDPAAPVLRVLALLVPLIAVSYVFGIQWMLPLGLDGPYIRIVLAAGLLNVALAAALAPRFAEAGMAWAVVISEAFVTASVYWFLRHRGLDPMTFSALPKGEVA
jgi:PST family polysaccharide transporter